MSEVQIPRFSDPARMMRVNLRIDAREQGAVRVGRLDPLCSVWESIDGGQRFVDAPAAQAWAVRWVRAVVAQQTITPNVDRAGAA
ncbi:MAG: hypothetical protein M3Q55_09250 [Acidobacteriota bacterium]|nr:hypothetical protein [Acidobacteriota bacterium]